MAKMHNNIAKIIAQAIEQTTEKTLSKVQPGNLFIGTRKSDSRME
jgi:hypothetical protein